MAHQKPAFAADHQLDADHLGPALDERIDEVRRVASGLISVVLRKRLPS
jgi:hypothetical protein